MQQVTIAGRTIGPGAPCFVIAEAGVNHNGSLELAKKLVDVAVEAGAGAIKFQTFKAERLVTQGAPKAEYQKQTTDPGQSQFEMLRQLELSPEGHTEIQAYCKKKNIIFISTPFDKESVDLLDKLGVPLFKIGSGEVTNTPFLEYVASKGKPIVLSTGMSYLSEVDEAVRSIRQKGNDQLVLLHCVSDYPADPADTNLRAMKTMACAFQLPVGYSDHTPGLEVALAAVALGACVLEKHFTLDRNLPGPDHRASLEPGELKVMVEGIRTIEKAMGSGIKQPAPGEIHGCQLIRRGLVAASFIPAGNKITPGMIAIKRPALGISPNEYNSVIGKVAARDIQRDEPITWKDLT